MRKSTAVSEFGMDLNASAMPLDGALDGGHANASSGAQISTTARWRYAVEENQIFG